MTHKKDDGFPEDDFYESGNVRDMEDHDEEPSEEGEAPNLEGLSLEDTLKLGRQILLEKLIKLVAQGMATPQEMNTLRQMLKDNGMVMGDPFEDDENEGATGEVRKSKPKADLPTFAPPDYTQ